MVKKLCVMGVVYQDLPVEAAADAISKLGFYGVQTQATYKDTVGEDLAKAGAKIKKTFAAKGLEVVALNAYVNLIDSDRDFLEKEMKRFRGLIENCHSFGTNIVATETGTKGQTTHKGFVAFDSHPDNDKEEAWAELRDRVQELVNLAEKHDVTIALEGVITNIVSSVERAERILREINSPHLALVLDPFNYVQKDFLPDVPGAMTRIVKSLAPRSVVAHAKDLKVENGRMVRPGPGLGIMTPEEYGVYLDLLEAEAPELPLVVEHVNKEQVLAAKQFVEQCR